MSSKIKIQAAFNTLTFESQVHIGSSVVLELQEALLKSKSTTIVVLVDENVKDKASNLYQSILGNISKKKIELVVSAGETSKNFSLLEKFSEQMLDAQVTRGDTLIAIGGGVVGDLGGLLASLYMRGINLIHVPTTIVAQVDSAIGGKTAVNLKGGKNMLGTFYPAKDIYCDLDFLSTLPDKEFKAGMAEVIKYGLIYSEEFFEHLKRDVSKIISKDNKVLSDIISFSVNAKLHFVMGDLEDKTGQRALLNFGHTIGHAIEKLTAYTEYLHGEAISIGMVFALEFGSSLGLTDKNSLVKTKKLLSDFGLPVEIPNSLLRSGNLEDVKKSWFDALLADKKRESSKVNFVFVDQIGSSKTKEVEVSQLVDFIFDKYTS